MTRAVSTCLQLALLWACWAVTLGSGTTSPILSSMSAGQNRASAGWQIQAVTPAQEVEIDTKFRTKAEHLWFRNLMPRPKKTFVNVSEPTDDYVKGIVAYPVIFIVFSFLSLVTWIIFGCCRCLCDGCGGSDARIKGYNEKERWIPYFILVFFAAGVAAAAATGLASNTRLNKALNDENEGLFSSAVGVLTTAASLLGGVRDQTQHITDQISPVVAQVSNILSDTVAAGTLGTHGLTDSLDAFGRGISGIVINVPSANRTFPCQFCQTSGAAISSANAEIRNKADGVLGDLDRVTGDVRANLLQKEGEIKSQAQDGINNIQDVITNVNNNKGRAQDNVDTAKDYEDYRHLGNLVILLLPLLGCVLVAVGGLTKIAFSFKCNYILGFFVLMLFWLLAAIHTPLSLALGDGCAYADDKQRNPQTILSNERAGDIVTSCLLNTSLVTALGIQDQFNFTEKIKFPKLPPIEQTFNFSELFALDRSVQALTFSTFGYNSSFTDQQLQQLSEVTAPEDNPDIIWTRANVRTCDENSYSNVGVPPTTRDKVRLLKASILGALDTEVALNNTLSAMKRNSSRIIAASDRLKSDAAKLQTAIGGVQDEVRDLFADTENFVRSVSCGELGARYGAVKHSVCDESLGALSGLAACFIIIGFCSIATVWLSIVLTKRIHKPAVHIEPAQEHVGIVPVYLGGGAGVPEQYGQNRQGQDNGQQANQQRQQEPAYEGQTAGGDVAITMGGEGAGSGPAVEMADQSSEPMPAARKGESDDGGFQQDLLAQKQRDDLAAMQAEQERLRQQEEAAAAGAGAGTDLPGSTDAGAGAGTGGDTSSAQ